MRATSLKFYEGHELNHEKNDNMNDIIIGRSEKMKQLCEIVEKVSQTNHPVLVTGPTGSGKEIVASMIHTLSNGGNLEFVDVNCGAIPENLIESHFFGHEKGAFTGAATKHDGYFSTVGNGILFLDEIAELSLLQQTKLLRVLETRKFRPIGSKNNITFQGKIIAATHRNLLAMVKDKTFREDLFYRLNTFHIAIPPLNERREDIPDFVSLFCKKQSKNVSFTGDAIKKLSESDWPGNIRQLKNTIDKISVLCTKTKISAEDIIPYIDKNSRGLDEVLNDIATDILSLDIDNKLLIMEQTVINKAMSICKGNKTKAAELLGVHRKVVERRLNSFDDSLTNVLITIKEATALMKAFNFVEANNKFCEAVEVLEKQPISIKNNELLLGLYLKIGVCIRSVKGWNSPELSLVYDKTKKISEQLSNVDSMSTLRFGDWINCLMYLDIAGAFSVGKKLLKEGEIIDSPYVISLSYTLLANTDFWRGDFVRADKYLTSFFELYTHQAELTIDYGVDPFVHYLMILCLNSFQLGRVEDSIESLEELLDYVKKINHTFSIAVALQLATWIKYQLGDYDKSYKYALKLVKFSNNHTFNFYKGIGMVFAGSWVSAYVDEQEGIKEICKGYNEVMLKDGGDFFNSMAGVVLGYAYLNNGDFENGIKVVDKSIDISIQYGELCYLSDQKTLKAELLILNGDFDLAERIANEARDFALKTTSITAELKAVNVLVGIMIKREEFDNALIMLTDILQKFTDGATYIEIEKAKNHIKSIKSFKNTLKKMSII